MVEHYIGQFKCRNHVIDFDGQHVKVMGIVNVTPDSFSDGGVNLDKDNAVRNAIKMFEAGVDIIDVGGESTRPGYTEVSTEEEIERVCLVIERISHETDAIISIDTYKPKVAEAALRSGAHILNDVTGFCLPEMRALAVQYKAGAVAMYNNRLFANDGQSILDKMDSFAINICDKIPSNLILDPGIGFGTAPNEDVAMMHHFEKWRKIAASPILLGLSRKRMVGNFMRRASEPLERDKATIGADLAGVTLGADIIRVHDVIGAIDSLRLWEAILNT